MAEFSTPIGELNTPNNLFFIMSLISQKDREMAIEALEFYVNQLKKDNCTPASITAFQTLLNWIELEHFKHEN